MVEKEQFAPQASDSLTYLEWMEANKKDCIQYALELMDHIIKTHEPEPLSGKEEQAIEDILNQARNHYRKTGLISDKEWETYKQDLNASGYPYQ